MSLTNNNNVTQSILSISFIFGYKLNLFHLTNYSHSILSLHTLLINTCKMETQKINGESSKDVTVATNKRNNVRFSDLLLRFMALALTLAAAVTLGLSKQTKIVPVTVVSTLPPINVPVTAKWHDMSAFT